MKARIIAGIILIFIGLAGLVQIGNYTAIFDIVLMIFMTLLFAVPGIYLLSTGLKKAKNKKDIDSFGEDCFGLVCKHVPTGTDINGKKVLRAKICVYISSSSEYKEFEKFIGLKSHEYPVGGFFRCKFYNDDINIKNMIGESEIPENILNELKKIYEEMPKENEEDEGEEE